MAVALTGLESDAANQALEILRRGKDVDTSVQEQVRSAAEALDDEYLNLAEDNAASPLARRFFAHARAASAVAFAAQSDVNQLHEAIYEALVAVEDAKELTTSVLEALASTID